jgi:phosphonopyruvate decarboxylase
MISPKFLFNCLYNENIDFFTGVPDSLLKSFCAYVTDYSKNNNHIIAANEGGAISLGVGYHIATNKIPFIYMQNSGLGNAINPLLSIADKDVYSIPMLMMIGWRGEPNIIDEPQHKKQGRVTIDMLRAMEIPYAILSANNTSDEVNMIIKEAASDARKNSSPYALVVKSGSFETYKLKSKSNNYFLLNREQSLKIIVDKLNKDDIIVATTGVTSRELFEYREELGQGHENDFLTVGGMGHANQIALGIALNKPTNQIFCFDGDGAILMHMGSLAINASLKCNNLIHIVFNNGAHDSVGGQPTVGHQISLISTAKSLGYEKVLIAKNENEIITAISLLKKYDGISLLEIQVNKGFRENLGRPSTSPIENKQDLMRKLK